MITPVTHYLPLTHVRRDRMLPVKGHILAGIGSRVGALDVVAEADVAGDHIILDIRRVFNLRSAEEALSKMRYKPGEKVEKGDILAQTGGLLPRVVRAPIDGKVIAITRGQVVLETAGHKYSLLAGITGTVTEVLPDRGLVIESDGALLQGVWGNGQIASGILLTTKQLPEEELTRSMLDVSLRSAVVVAGFVAHADTLVAAHDLPVRALVLSSITADLIDQAREAEFPIILMEGFGRIPLNQTARGLLTSNLKRDIVVNATMNRERFEIPELFIPLPAQGQPTQEYAELTKGKTVRVTIQPYEGQAATVVTLRPGLTRLTNGQRVTAADIQLESGQIVTLPLANLDVLE